MDNKEFGLKIRDLREKLCFTREQFCEDETKLSIRQLTRIEAGTSKPTFSTINYIASRLGITLYELMPDYIELPDRYKKLKYDVLRTPTYGEEEMLDQRNSYLTEIYDDYYDLLSEEECVAVDAIQSTIDVKETSSSTYGKGILDNYFHQIFSKKKFDANDLLIIRLFIEHARLKEDSSEEFKIFLKLVDKLPKQVSKMEPEELFVLRDVLLVTMGVLGSRERYDDFPKLFASLEAIMKVTHDFQKKPILSMIMWKYELFVHNNKEKAEIYYEEAKIFSKMIGNEYLSNKIVQEWIEDNP